MKLWEYIKDKKYLIFLYLLLLAFINSTIYLDSDIKVDGESILYINLVSTVFFLIYLLIEYLCKRRHYSVIKDIVENKSGDIINYLPEPKTFEDNLYKQLFKRMYDDESSKFQTLQEEIKDNQEFITSWVHEVKTPISVIRLIIENGYNKSPEEVLSSIEDEVDKIEDQVEQALYYSRIDSFSKDYFIKEIDLNKASKEAIKRHAKTFINKKIKVEVEERELIVLTDKKWLGFIIDQVLSNSLKYTTEGGTIKFSLYQDSIEKRLIIEDTGIGIKPEDICRVFNKGFTGSTGRQYQKSTGMGLYLAKKLSRKLGHDITIESSYGEYTRVTIHFPKLTDYFSVTKM